MNRTLYRYALAPSKLWGAVALATLLATTGSAQDARSYKSHQYPADMVDPHGKSVNKILAEEAARRAALPSSSDLGTPPDLMVSATPPVRPAPKPTLPSSSELGTPPAWDVPNKPGPASSSELGPPPAGSPTPTPVRPDIPTQASGVPSGFSVFGTGGVLRSAVPGAHTSPPVVSAPTAPLVTPPPTLRQAPAAAAHLRGLTRQGWQFVRRLEAMKQTLRGAQAKIAARARSGNSRIPLSQLRALHACYGRYLANFTRECTGLRARLQANEARLAGYGPGDPKVEAAARLKAHKRQTNWLLQSYRNTENARSQIGQSDPGHFYARTQISQMLRRHLEPMVAAAGGQV